MAVNTELSGTTRQVPGFYLTSFILCQFQGKLTGTLPDSAMCVKPADSACCVLGMRC
jgi:hypothetical protein